MIAVIKKHGDNRGEIVDYLPDDTPLSDHMKDRFTFKKLTPGQWNGLRNQLADTFPAGHIPTPKEMKVAVYDEVNNKVTVMKRSER